MWAWISSSSDSSSNSPSSSSSSSSSWDSCFASCDGSTSVDVVVGWESVLLTSVAAVTAPLVFDGSVFSPYRYFSSSSCGCAVASTIMAEWEEEIVYDILLVTLAFTLFPYLSVHVLSVLQQLCEGGS